MLTARRRPCRSVRSDLLERGPHALGRDAVPAVPAGPLREDGRDHAPAASTTGPPELPAPDRAANRRHPARRGEVPVRVATDDAGRPCRRERRSPYRGRCRGTRAGRPVSLRLHPRAAGVAPPGRERGGRRRRSCCRTRRRGPRGGRRRCDRREESSTPATTCAFVTTSPGPATQPEPSIPSPQASPTTRTTLSAAALTPADSRTAGSGASTLAPGPARRAEGVDARERVDQPGRRDSWLSVDRMVESWA